MGNMIFVVQSSPLDPAKEDEFNRWYAGTHIPQVLSLPGMVRATRYRFLDGGVGEKPAHRFMVMYESENDDPGAVLGALGAAVQEGKVQMEGAPIDIGTVQMHFYEEID